MSDITKAALILADSPTVTGARQALQALGLRFPFATRLDPHNPQECSSLPDKPVVLKVSQPFIPHKTEMGAVRVCDKLTPEILADFTSQVEARLGESVREVTLEEKITIPEGGETLLSLLYDDAFGPTVVFGHGGRLTEAYRQVVRWLPDETPEKISRILQSLPLYKVWFQGFRGMEPQCDLQSWSVFLHKFGMMISQFHDLRPDLIVRDLEINPVAFTGSEPVALDLLLTVEKRQAENRHISRPDLQRLHKALFQAERIAVAGVSATDTNNLGRVLYDRLRKNFSGQSWAINIKGGEIEGQPVYKSVKDLPAAPDVLVISLSAKLTPGTLKDAYDTFGNDLGAVLMLASGFDETTAGKHIAEELKDVASTVGGTPLLGPNTMALYSQTENGNIQVDFLPEGRVTMPSFADPSKNNAALILQSGARFTSFVDKIPTLGFRWSIMVGNAYQTDIADGLELAALDEHTQVAAIYMEGLKPQGGLRLAQAVRACRDKGKAVVIQKGGRTAKGAAAARSHTASMSGSHEVFKAILEQAGALVVENETEFTDAVRIASSLADRKPQGPNVFVLNGAGYEGVLASDEAARQGLELPKPPAQVSEVLTPIIGKILDVTNNPADVGPATPEQYYLPILEAALNSPVYDSALVAVMPFGNGLIGVLHEYDKEGSIGNILIELHERYQKPIVVSVNGGYKYDGFRRYLESHGIPVFADSEKAMSALGLWYGMIRRC